MNIWNGVFAPMNKPGPGLMVKHRDYCGDFTNHLAVTFMEPWTKDREQEIKDLKDIEEITELRTPNERLDGEVDSAWLVRVEFVPNGDQWYDFKILSPGYDAPYEDDIIMAVAIYFEPDPEG